MKAVVDRDAFARALKHIEPALDRKAPINAQHIRLEVVAGTLTIAASDLVLSATASLPAEGEGLAFLHGRLLLDAVEALPAGELSLTTKDDHRATVVVRKSRFEVPGISPDDAPAPTQLPAEWIELSADVLGHVIAIVRHACSSDNTRPHLMGVQLESDGKLLTARAVDGHRAVFACAEIDAPRFVAFLPVRIVEKLSALLKDAERVEIAHGSSVRALGRTLTCALPDGEFPLFDQLFPPGDRARVATAPRATLLAAAQGAAQINAKEDKSPHCAAMSIREGEIEFEASNALTGSADIRIEATTRGKPLRIGINGQYLADTLGAFPGEEITLSFDGELDPIRVQPAGDDRVAAVIMPVRV